MAIGTSGNQFKNAGVAGRLMRELIEVRSDSQRIESSSGSCHFAPSSFLFLATKARSP